MKCRLRTGCGLFLRFREQWDCCCHVLSCVVKTIVRSLRFTLTGENVWAFVSARFFSSQWIEQEWQSQLGAALTIIFILYGLVFFSFAGLFAAAHNMNIEWVIVKGISHLSDDRNTPDESWKSFASVMAASVVSNMLNDPVVFKEWPHYEGMSHPCWSGWVLIVMNFLCSVCRLVQYYPWFKFFLLFKLKSFIYINIPNKIYFEGFQIYNAFLIRRLDSKASARDSHKDRTTDTRYLIILVIIHYPGFFPN